MLLRTLALLVSLLIHGALGYALWPRLQQKELEILDLGSGMDIELMPQGLVMSEVASRGDDVESLETQDVVPLDERKPPPKPTDREPVRQLSDISAATKDMSEHVASLDVEKHIAPAPKSDSPDQLRDMVDENKKASDVASVDAKTPSQVPPAVAEPDQLQDVPEAAKAQSNDDIAALEAQNPTSEPAPVAASQQLNDVLEAQEVRDAERAPAVHVEEPVAKPTATAPARQLRDVIEQVEKTEEKKIATLPVEKPAPKQPVPSPATPMRDIEATEESPVHSDVAMAPQPPSPDVLREPKAGKAGDLPPPPELKEEERIAKIQERLPQRPIPEHEPDTVEVLVRPTQVAVVSEMSSGEEKKGGDARSVNIYLGRVNAQMQHAKVNPRSRETGTVILRFKVATDGTLLSKEVALSSGSPMLDAAALSTLLRAAPFPPIPPEVSTKPMTFSQLFRFIIR